MRKRLMVAAAIAAAACTALTACGSSGGGSGGGASDNSDGSGTIKIGYLADLTGPASSGYSTSEKGVKAYLNRINDAGGINGKKIEYVMADTASTPPGALTAVQKLHEKDHVFAIVENSSVYYGAQAYALKNNIPVVGSAIDGPIWTDPKNTNLFSAVGPTNSEYVELPQGQYAKNQGATKCGSIGYASSVSAQNSASGFIQACQDVGLKKGYLNNQVQFGSTDVGPMALAIKNSHTDALFLPVVPNTAFALIGALHQLGVKMKTVLLATGYGGDLLSSKAAIQAGQGVDFMPISVPVEANTPATKQMAADLAKVGVTGPPTFAEQEAFLTLTAFVTGLKAAGPNATPDSFAKALRAVKNYDGGGLVPHKFNFSDWVPKNACLWVVRLTGKKFVVRPNVPVCGSFEKLKK